ncbi:MAG: methyltransferase domain-containing protein, partial [Myxococcota bacterium]|nr:methyltransferase domain-containing protein [Myxococcota bacterium]
MAAAEPDAPSPWLLRHADRLREAARAGPVLDVACGRGRHVAAVLALGARVMAVDRDREALAAARRAAAAAPSRLLAVRADVEA